ncbi:MAG TPA: Arc family DNA-binding protein [Gammaproteobacteria bacterium]|nr:Arc family DNA-binding protein [Gammaproteobacteria bacterium]
MASTSIYPLRLPTSLKEQVAKVAKRDCTSMNQFIAIAVAEKLSAMDTERLFSDHMKEADMEAFRKILFREGGEAPRSGDEIL